MKRSAYVAATLLPLCACMTPSPPMEVCRTTPAIQDRMTAIKFAYAVVHAGLLGRLEGPIGTEDEWQAESDVMRNRNGRWEVWAPERLLKNRTLYGAVGLGLSPCDGTLVAVLNTQ